MDYTIVLGVIDTTTMKPGLVVGQCAGLVAFQVPQVLKTIVDAARNAILGAMRDHAEEQQLGEYQQPHDYDELQRTREREIEITCAANHFPVQLTINSRLGAS